MTTIEGATVLVTGATDGLVNNAGLISEERRVTEDGLELTF